MTRIAACLAALALACGAGASAHAWDGGASAPHAAESGGGLAAPTSAPLDGAGAAQVGQPPPAPDLPDPEPPPAPDPDGTSEPDRVAPDAEPPAPEDRETGIVVPLPLPDDSAGEPDQSGLVAISSGSLPRTGQDTYLLGAIGLLLLAAGGAVRLVSRRARARCA